MAVFFTLIANLLDSNIDVRDHPFIIGLLTYSDDNKILTKEVTLHEVYCLLLN